tara:strand:- start:54 stop:581 length:528 start_codon:yes stop_codon:yes gene_type:complete
MSNFIIDSSKFVEPCVPLLWSNTTNVALTALSNSTKTYRGENFTGGTDVVGKIVNEVKLNLAEYDTSLDGTVYVVIVKADFSEIEIGSKAGSAITNRQPTWTEYTFTNNDNDYVMEADDMVCVKYGVSGTSGNRLACQYSTNDPTDTTYVQKVGATWTTNITGQSQPMKIYTDCS